MEHHGVRMMVERGKMMELVVGGCYPPAGVHLLQVVGRCSDRDLGTTKKLVAAAASRPPGGPMLLYGHGTAREKKQVFVRRSFCCC